MSAVVGRGCFDDLDAAFSEMLPAERRVAFDGLACAALGVDPSPPLAPAAPPPRVDDASSIKKGGSSSIPADRGEEQPLGQGNDRGWLPSSTRRFANHPVVDFTKGHLQPRRGGRVQSTHLHRAYLRWAEINGRLVLTNNMLAKELMRIGLSKIKVSHIYWLDVELAASTAPSGAV